MTLHIVHRDRLPQRRGDGLRETRLVAARRAASRGLGSFVYLADTELDPEGHAGQRAVSDVDLVSIVIAGRVEFRGTLAAGTLIGAGGGLVQRAGHGLEQDEHNPDTTPARVLQLRFLSPARGYIPAYEVFELTPGVLGVVLGGTEGTFDNACTLRVGILPAGARFEHPGECIAYVALGRGSANGSDVTAGHLLDGRDLTLVAEEDLTVALVTRTPMADGAA
jgi:quercetin 2,3-dioxygenase